MANRATTRINGTSAFCFAVLTVLAPACTEPYTAPPLGPSPEYIAPPTTPPPAPPPAAGGLPLAVVLTVGPNSPTAGNDAAFTAVASGAMTAPIAYTWNFGDGGNRTTGTATTFYTFSKSGSYQASVKVSDAKGLTATGTATITVQPRTSTPTPPPPPPPALRVSLACTPQGLTTPTSCNLTLSFDGATVPSSMITEVMWNWGDGSPVESGANPAKEHAYTQTGSHTAVATVTATTTAGPKTASGSATIVTPTLSASLACTPRALLTPTPCNVTASYSGATVPSAAFTVDWDWGDSLPAAPGPAANDHSYTQVRSYTVVVTVTATTMAGEQEATATATVTIPPPTLSVTLACTAGVHFTPTNCSVTASYNGATNPSASITNVDWNWGDGSTNTTAAPSESHEYQAADNFVVIATVTATTTDGAKTAAATRSLTIP